MADIVHFNGVTKLVGVLLNVREYIALESNDFFWSSWGNQMEALEEVDSFIQALKDGELINESKLILLFAPTGPIQEVSLSSGWAQPFLKISSQFDTAVIEYRET